MKVFPRSVWTPVLPRATRVGDEYVGLPWYSPMESLPDTFEFEPVGKDFTYALRNPVAELSKLVKEAQSSTGLTDLNYNFAIAQNASGIFVVRGAFSKCQKTSDYRVLMLIGNHERPTDVLKANQQAILDGFHYQPPFPKPRFAEGDANVQVFDLIEYLASEGYYEGRNDGVFGPFCKRAVQKLQYALDLPELSGKYDEITYEALCQKTKIQA